MSVKSTYRDVILEDGCYVLGKVVSTLYRGENFRPDLYFRRDQILKRKHYNGIFNSEQRQKITESGLPEEYDVEIGVRHYDVSLLTLLAEHTCGLSSGASPLKEILQLRDLRNRVSHPSSVASEDDINDANFNDRINAIFRLYIGIVSATEAQIGGRSLALVLRQIHSKLARRLEEARAFQAAGRRQIHENNISPPSTRRRAECQPTEQQSCEIPTWGKVALGVAGVAAVAVGAIAASSLDKRNKDKENRRGNQTHPASNSSKGNDCHVM